MIVETYFLVAAVVLTPLLMAVIFLVVRDEHRARKRPDPLQDYFDSIGMPTDKRGHWF